jgi:hypothetical protein
MAVNFDAINNPFRTFRFTAENNLETLKRERPQDVLDVVEYGTYCKTKSSMRTIVYCNFGVLVGYTLSILKLPQFHSLRPFTRATLLVFLPVAHQMTIKSYCQAFVEKTLDDLLVAKTNKFYEDPVIVKHRGLTA